MDRQNCNAERSASRLRYWQEISLDQCKFENYANRVTELRRKVEAQLGGRIRPPIENTAISAAIQQYGLYSESEGSILNMQDHAGEPPARRRRLSSLPVLTDNNSLQNTLYEESISATIEQCGLRFQSNQQ